MSMRTLEHFHAVDAFTCDEEDDCYRIGSVK